MRRLQLSHMALIFIIPICFVILKIVASDTDDLLKVVNNLILLIGVLWAAYNFVLLLIKGKTADAKDTALNKYRSLLMNSRSFLWTTNIVMLIFAGIFVYQLVFFRDIEFYSDRDYVDLYESADNGTRNKIGEIPPNSPMHFRIHVGVKYLGYQRKNSFRYTSLPPLYIPILWNKMPLESVIIHPKLQYESTE